MHTLDLDRTEPELEIQGGKSMRWGGPQVTSCMDTNLALDQGKPHCITPNLWLLFWINIFMLTMIVHWVD
jgi:hypothetical protein